MWLFLMFVVLPAIELAVVIKVGAAIGVLPTIGLMILSATAGSWLIRRQGTLALADVQRSFRELRDPTGPLAHGALILLAGVLMVAPGFLTDITGLALLFPAVRRLVMGQLAARVRVTRAGFGFPQQPQPGPFDPSPRGSARPGSRTTIIDADYVVVPDPPRPGRPSGWTRD